MDSNVIKVGEFTVRVINPENQSDTDISPEDKEMDQRAVAAVKSAIKKAKVCKKPIAKYDSRKKKAYIEQADGVKEYVN